MFLSKYIFFVIDLIISLYKHNILNILCKSNKIIKMKKLINTLKKIEQVLLLIEILLKKEHHCLLNNNINMFNSIIQKKEKLFKKIIILNQEKIFFEKQNSIFSPYVNQEINYYSLKINQKCILLRDLNRKNKIIMNKNFYLNQRFLELLISHKISVTDTFHSDLKI